MRRGFRSQAAPPRGLVPCPQSDLEKQGRISRKSEGLSLPLAGSGRAKDFRNYGRVDGAVQRCGRLGPSLLRAGAAVPEDRGPAEGRRPAGGPVGTVWPLPASAVFAFAVALPVVPDCHCLRCHSERDLGQLSVSVL